MKKITLAMLTVLLVLGLLLSACAPQESSTSLAGSAWKLDSYGTTGNQTPAAPGIETSLVFGANGEVSGFLGCNSFSGSYQVKDGKLIFGPLAATLMACPDPQMTQEGSAFQILTGSLRFDLTGTSLTIFDASGTLALTFSPVTSK